jgi:subtilisin family serine protease
MTPLEYAGLKPLMERTKGRPEIMIGLIDGPVFMSHPDLAPQNIREILGGQGGACSRAASQACVHGTFVAGMLIAKRGSDTTGICPDCILLVRPIFAESGSAGDDPMPSATAEDLAAAIIETVKAGARVLNLSVALAQPSPRGERAIEAALSFAAQRGAIVVAAAGNQGAMGGTAITSHLGVIPVAACDFEGRPAARTNLGGSIGRRGLSAPGEGVISLGTNGPSRALAGTSAAAPFVTGAVALLWSEFPTASASRIKLAITRSGGHRRNSVVPPLLDAWAAYKALAGRHGAN